MVTVTSYYPPLSRSSHSAMFSTHILIVQYWARFILCQTVNLTSLKLCLNLVRNKDKAATHFYSIVIYESLHKIRLIHANVKTILINTMIQDHFNDIPLQQH